MLIMTRQATIRPGKLKEALPFVAEATDRVSGLLDGQEVAAYIVPFGAPTGTVVYSTSHESLAHQTEAMSRLV